MTDTVLTTGDVDEIAAVFDAVFAPIALWRETITAELAAASAPPSRAIIDAMVEGLVGPELSRRGGLVIGAGFVAAPDFLADAPWHLAWWLSEANTFGLAGRRAHLRRLVTVEDPTAESFRDHTSLEWWRVPERTHARHITGPYVDYLCTDEYTMTLTDPVLVGGSLVGVVGADLYVNDAERALLPPLRRFGPRASLVNAAARVIVSTDPHRATGSLLRDAGIEQALRMLPAHGTAVTDTGARIFACGTTSLAVVAGDEPAP